MVEPRSDGAPRREGGYRSDARVAMATTAAIVDRAAMMSVVLSAAWGGGRTRPLQATDERPR